MRFKNFCAVFLLTFFNGFAQSNGQYEFFGALKLNGNDKEIISYRIVFEENKGVVSGFSITDLGGEHETKNKIVGTYDKKKKWLTFRESTIVYTKSKITRNSFCYVNFSGSVVLAGKNPKLDDKFQGLFPDKSKCIDGTIQMIGAKKIIQTVKRVEKKIKNSKRVDEATKEKYNPIKMMDSLASNTLRAKQNLKVFTKDNTITVEIKDSGVEDGDRINLYINGKVILSDYTVKIAPKVVKITLDQAETDITIEALNEGESAPNTADVILRDSQNEIKTISKLKKGNSTIVTIIKE